MTSLVGVLLYCLVHQAFKRLASLMSLLVSCQFWSYWGERGYSVGSAPCVSQQYRLAPGLLSSPPKAFPSAVASLMSLWAIFPQSTVDFTLGLLSNPYTPAPSRCAFQGAYVPVQSM